MVGTNATGPACGERAAQGGNIAQDLHQPSVEELASASHWNKQPSTSSSKSDRAR